MEDLPHLPAKSAVRYPRQAGRGGAPTYLKFLGGGTQLGWTVSAGVVCLGEIVSGFFGEVAHDSCRGLPGRRLARDSFFFDGDCFLLTFYFCPTSALRVGDGAAGFCT